MRVRITTPYLPASSRWLARLFAQEAYVAAGVSLPVYTDTTVGLGTTIIKAGSENGPYVESGEAANMAYSPVTGIE